MTAIQAARIRRGIALARQGTDLAWRLEHPETIDAYLRTASREGD